MMDAPDRPAPRFPPEKGSGQAEKIADALDTLGAGPDDLALAQGASGGDILFLEACRERGVRLQMMLPLQEPEFIQRSILPSADGENWRDRYYALKAGTSKMPRASCRTNSGRRPRMWIPLNAAICGCSTPPWPMASNKVRFICLWDGSGVMGREAPSICTTKSRAGPGG